MTNSTNSGKLRRLVRRFPLTLFCVALTWYLCLFKPPHTPLDGIGGVDKFVHFLMYSGTCSVLWFEYHRGGFRTALGLRLFLGVLAPIAMSGIIELCQAYLTTTRSGEWADFFANSLGVLAAFCASLLWQRYRHAA